MDPLNPYSPPQCASPSEPCPSTSARNRDIAGVGGFRRWLFAPLPHRSPWQAVAWWEARRIPVNILIGAYGTFCLAVFFWAITSSHVLQPGEDAVEPLAIMITPFLFNICYTLGWLVEVPARLANPKLSPRFGPLQMSLGLVFSFCVISLPAAIWVGYRCLQLAGLL
jgi:hypothetical protein